MKGCKNRMMENGAGIRAHSRMHERQDEYNALAMPVSCRIDSNIAQSYLFKDGDRHCKRCKKHLGEENLLGFVPSADFKTVNMLMFFFLLLLFYTLKMCVKILRRFAQSIVKKVISTALKSYTIS